MASLDIFDQTDMVNKWNIVRLHESASIYPFPFVLATMFTFDTGMDFSVIFSFSCAVLL